MGARARPQPDPGRPPLRAVFILALAFGLLLSVMLHEAGHFFTARRYGMKATQFFVGFGPTLWSRHKGETEYGAKALPLGGFVKIIGMTPLEEVPPGDEDRAFYKKSPGRKTVVLAAGSTVHFLICLVLVLLTTVFYGTPRESAPELTAISSCLNDDPRVECTASSATSPAALAGLRKDDTILAVNGKAVTSDSLVSAIKGATGKQVALTVERDGATKVLTVVPRAVTRPGAKAAVGAIGVSIAAKYHNEHHGVVGTVKQTGSTIGTIVTATVDAFTEKLGTITKVYSDERDPAGFVGLYGAGRISGEIGSLEVPLGDRVASMVLMLAGLNLFIGVFNLLPLLPLDGGHIAVVCFETVRDRIKRARGYVGEVVRVDYNRLMPLTLAVVVLFATFTVFLLGADIVNPITLGQ